MTNIEGALGPNDNGWPDDKVVIYALPRDEGLLVITMQQHIGPLDSFITGTEGWRVGPIKGATLTLTTDAARLLVGQLTRVIEVADFVV